MLSHRDPLGGAGGQTDSGVGCHKPTSHHCWVSQKSPYIGISNKLILYLFKIVHRLEEYKKKERKHANYNKLI